MTTLHEMPSTIRKYLDELGAHYEVIDHPREVDAQRTAAVTHTPGAMFAKCLLVKIDVSYALVVLPADHRFDGAMLAKAALAKHSNLVNEEEMEHVFPDCELGAEPPLGELYGLPVYVSVALADAKTITFNAGTHEQAVRMTYAEFERMAQPTVVDCSVKVHG
jgi:Ala-tRNA(Pro) deacylase